MKKSKHKKHFLKKYKKKLKNTIISDVLYISCKDIEALDLDIVPTQMFQSSSSPDDSIINNAELDSMLFSIGYASVAINLLDICQYSRNNIVKDSYIFPALYSFRIYMENTMKESIILFKGKIKEDDLKKHSLLHLWEMLTRYLESDQITKTVRKLLEDFDSYDPDSTAFRYCHIVNRRLGDNKGRVLNSCVSIETLRTSMLYIYRILEGINEQARHSKEKIE